MFLNYSKIQFGSHSRSSKILNSGKGQIFDLYEKVSSDMSK